MVIFNREKVLCSSVVLVRKFIKLSDKNYFFFSRHFLIVWLRCGSVSLI